MDKVVLMHGLQTGCHVASKFQQQPFLIEGLPGHTMTTQVGLQVSLERSNEFKGVKDNYIITMHE